MKTIKQVKNLKGKLVLLRVDYNVPLEKAEVKSDMKLRASIPTIEYLIEKKAKIILITHLGRPGGKVVSGLKVDPVMHRLSKLLGKKIIKLETRDWRLGDKKKIDLLKQIENMKNGSVSMMENIRFCPDEKNNKGVLAQELANLADIFVLDGFAVAHRDSASVAGVAKIIPAYAGLLLSKEVRNLKKVMIMPKKPYVLILGGIKVETKIPLVEKMKSSVNHILIGGGLANTYFKAKGYDLGESLVDVKYLKKALRCCSHKKILVPVDVVVGKKNGRKFHVVQIKNKRHRICKKGEAIFDIGPETIKKYRNIIKKARTLVWNGAMGYFEQKPYDVGTLTIARSIADRSSLKSVFALVGGGETILSLKEAGCLEKIDFVSTGGGAMLEYLSGKELPGISSLEN
ncbi:MAG: phosphoglycerate kinase [Candidatus Magasanikbacteria bacterium]|nr:phosphoglycerate kinase [Candidatus Magasanikbacteria bacterium]